MAAGVHTEQASDEQRVAILLASMDERLAAGVLQQLEPEVMGRVANAIRKLGVVSGSDRQKAISDCLNGINRMTNAVQGDDKLVASLLTKAIGEKRALALLQDETTVSRVAFEGLRDVSPEQIVSVLGTEQPALLGSILRYLPPEQSGMVLNLLPTEVRNKTVVHICKSHSPSSETIERIEQYVRNRFKQTRKEDKVEAGDAVDIISSLIQHVDKSVQEDLLKAIEEVSESMAGRIKDRLFTFEDIISMDDSAVRRLLQEIDVSVLAVALRSASVDLKQKFFKNMSKRAGESIREEMEYAQKMKLSDIQLKQKEIVDIIRSLEVDGQISVSGGEEEYV